MTETSFRGAVLVQKPRMTNTPGFNQIFFSSTASQQERATDSERETKADTSFSPLETEMISLLTQCLSHALLYLSFIYLFYSLLFNFSFHLHSQLPLLSFLSFFFLHAFPYISIHNKGATVPRATNFLPSFFIKHLSLSLSSPGLIPAVDKTMLAHLGSR